MLESNEEKLQRVLIVWAKTKNSDDDLSVINELKGLIETAQGITVESIIQNRDRIDNATVVGKGKLEEIKGYIEMMDIDVVVFENELSPSQIGNIQKFLPCKVIDRTALILDIFALHAKTAEGKLQVELAQLRYLLPRLAGSNQELSRQGGGIGTRGPGETKLETDRRYIRNRIRLLNDQIDLLTQHRENMRKKREKNQVKTVALVGYTNSGKSRLLNTLTGADVLSENKLFATLDPTVRSLLLPSGNTVLVIDTVGFIRDIPTGLIAAFRSTLEEAVNCTLILNVCDISSPKCQDEIDVTLSTLAELHATSPIVTVYNKIDLLDEDSGGLPDKNGLFVSALYGTNVDGLIKIIDNKLFGELHERSFLFPYYNQKLLFDLKSNSIDFNSGYTDDGILVTCKITDESLLKYKAFMKNCPKN
ncbi:MAG: GTPase HflX [Clostridia bacterium]|nr:GTPase HflX [Clostridia bacterium]